MVLRIIAPPPEDKLGDFQRLGRNVHGYFVQIKQNVAAPTSTDATFVLSALQAGLAFAAMIQAQDADLVVAYRAWTGQTGLQVQADATAALTALQGVNAAILAMYPLDGSRRLLDRTMDVNGVLAPVMLSAASLTPVSTAITAWQAAIQ